MIPALLGLIAPVAAVKVLSGLVRAAGAALRSATAPAALPVPPVVEKAAEVSEQVSDSPVIFAYDGMSRRTKITEYTNGTVTSKKLYWWLGGSIACERDGLVSGFPITKRYFGQGVLQGTTKLFYTTDHLGSVRELVDDAGTVQAQYRYSTYGERTKETGNLDSDWGYAGLWHHQASGLDLATYRLYDAANKRWISRDPLGEGSDFTLYSYCGNNPISFLDPEGLDRIYASADAHSTPNGSIRIQIDYGYEGLDPSTVVIGAEAVVTARMRNRPTPMQVNEGPANVPLSTNVRPGDLVLNSRILLPRLRPGKSDYTNQTIPTKTPGKPAGTGYRELEVTVRIIPPKDYAEVPGQEVFLVIYEITKEGCLARVKFRYPKKEQRSKAQR